MPCGGIYYFGDGNKSGGVSFCLQCSKKDGFGIGMLDHFCEEWDGYLHSRCVVAFLESETGQTVINHNHTLELGPEVVFVRKDLVEVESVEQPQIAADREG